MNYFFWTALTDPWKFFTHPLSMILVKIWKLQKGIPPFRFHPRPDGFDRIEIGRTGRQIFRFSSTVLQKVLDLFTPVRSVIIHDNHFVIKLFTPFVSCVEVLDRVNWCWISHQVKQRIILHTDSSNDCNVLFLLLSPLNYQRQDWILRLPDFGPCSPTISRRLIHVNNFPSLYHVFEDLFDKSNSQIDHFFFTSSTVKTAMDL